MAGCIISNPTGVAGFTETVGGSLDILRDGTGELRRVYQGPAGNVPAFLQAFPEGVADVEFTEFTRTQQVRVAYNSGWAFVTLTFGGPAFSLTEPEPFRVTKGYTERSVTLEFTDDGLTGGYECKYSTLAHTVEYTSAGDSDNPSKQSQAGLPGQPDQAIYFQNANPVIKVGNGTPFSHLGGSWAGNDGSNAALVAGTHYDPIIQCIDYTRSKDRGSRWQMSETWAVICLALKE